MNLKVAHLVSIQFGIFIGIVCCVAFSRFEYFRPRATAESRERAAERAAAVEPLSQSEEQTIDVDDNGADAELAELVTEQPAPALPNEYSSEAVDRYRAEATRLYYEQIAPRRTVSAIAAVAPAYTEVTEEPVAVQANEPAPETVAYVQPTQVIVYPQPVQLVVFSHSRRLRCRPASPPEAVALNPHRPASALQRPARAPGLAHHRNTGGRSCPPTQEFTPRSRR